jgi:hypothetical protein
MCKSQATNVELMIAKYSVTRLMNKYLYEISAFLTLQFGGDENLTSCISAFSGSFTSWRCVVNATAGRVVISHNKKYIKGTLYTRECFFGKLHFSPPSTIFAICSFILSDH